MFPVKWTYRGKTSAVSNCKRMNFLRMMDFPVPVLPTRSMLCLASLRSWRKYENRVRSIVGTIMLSGAVRLVLEVF